MNCPNCGIMTDDNTCPNCNVDILQSLVVEKMSFDSYNKGLTFAKDNDISNAIIELKKSIKFNSSNITALNLLGLCYDKIGQIADASKYWIHSCLVLEENIASEYLKSVEENVAKREKLNDSIKMYNQALVYSKQKNFDIAIIQLKNSIDKNENFIEALNLLALIYINIGEKEKAVPLLKRVIKIDKNNEKAKNYLFSLNIKIQSKSSNKKAKENNDNSKKNKEPKYKEKANYSIKHSLISYGLGLMTMLLLYILLIIPNIESSFKMNSLSNERNFTEQIKQQETMLNANQTEINNLTTENEQLKEQNTTLKNEYDSLNVYVNLLKADEFFNARDYKMSASAISSIVQSAVSPDQIDAYNDLKNKVYPLASKSYYDTGVSKYSQTKYQEALDDFVLSVEYGSYTDSYYPSTLFYIGRCYEGLGNNEQAKAYYQKIIDDFPNSDTAYSAKSRLNTIS